MTFSIILYSLSCYLINYLKRPIKTSFEREEVFLITSSRKRTFSLVEGRVDREFFWGGGGGYFSREEGKNRRGRRIERKMKVHGGKELVTESPIHAYTRPPSLVFFCLHLRVLVHAFVFHACVFTYMLAHHQSLLSHARFHVCVCVCSNAFLSRRTSYRDTSYYF